MRFLKILGMVVALHVVLFTVFLLSPGCQSNPTTPAPTSAGTEAAAPTSTLAPIPVDENWSSQPKPASSSMATAPANPVSTTISSSPLPGVPMTAGDAGRAAPSRPTNPESYVSTGGTPPPALNPPPTQHVIRAGDNLAKIADKYGTTVTAIQKANPGIKPQSLRVGQIIKLPANITGTASTAAGDASASVSGAKYTVRQGDSLSAIAARNGTTVTALRQANNLRSDTLQVGQILIIPGGVSSGGMSTLPASGYTAAPATSRPTNTISGDASTTTIEHTLRSGETLGGLSKRYGVSVDQIKAANNIIDARKIRAGQKLQIPGARSPAPAAASTPRPAAPTTTAPVAPAPISPAADPVPATSEPLPETQPPLPADMLDAPPIPVDEPVPTP